MNAHYRKLISCVTSLLVLAVTLASNASPAQAAASITVGYDHTQCPSATFTNIQSAINSLGSTPTGTITICAGTYGTDGLNVRYAHNLKLIGKPGAVITQITVPYNGVMLNVFNSTNVTVQGLTFDGQGEIAALPTVTALQFQESSGTIQKNSVTNWHVSNYATAEIYSIHVINSLGESVKVLNNTITVHQSRGIQIEGNTKVTVSGNTITPSSDSSNSSIGIYVLPIGSAAPKGTISKNTIVGYEMPGSSINSGIWIVEAGHLTISGNTLNHLVFGIEIFSSCLYGADASKNKITGNKLNEVLTGIQVEANAFNSCDAHLDNYSVTGNKIIDTVAQGAGGIVFSAQGSTSHGYVLNETVKGNTITHFNIPVFPTSYANGTVSGKFLPNKINP